MKEKYIPGAELSEGETVKAPPARPRGRGNLTFPEWKDLKVSKDGATGDCLIYEDNPYNRKLLIQTKCNYNRRGASFKGKHFVHRYEIRHGNPVIVIQRIV